MFGNVELVENDLYYFDEESADRPVRFIEKYLKHFQGRHAGKSFILLPWQKTLVRTLFGWKKRSDNLRRFRELYLISAKGCGKTPLFSSIGCFMMLGDKEAAPHVISMASSSEQARYTFDAAKAYIKQSKELSRFATPKQHEIRGTKNGGKWTTISGKPNGRSGSAPHCVIADECHEWAGPTAEAFDLVTKNAFKCAQSLVLIATNAGGNRNCFAWQVHERALAIRDGEIKDDTVLPVIFEAPEELPWDSEEAARAANPSMPDVVKFEHLAPALTKAKESAETQSSYERLYLSRWPKVSTKAWLNMGLWDDATKDFDPATLKDAVLYTGLDLSLNNDLSAATFVYATPDKFYVDAHFWMPRARAEEHQQKFAVPYLDWEKEGKLTLVDGPTIDPATRLQIAAYIAAKGKAHKLKAVCYDTYKADQTIAALEAGGVTCIPIRQGFSVSPGCEELDRRLQESSIVLSPSGCLRFCAANTQIKTDNKGNIWPTKPNANGTYAGTRWQKIDGISALVTGLTEARKHAFANARKMYNGGATGGVSVIKAPAPKPLPVPRPLPRQLLRASVRK